MSVLSVMFEVRVTEVKQNSVKSVKRLSECLSGVKSSQLIVCHQDVLTL